MSANAPQPTTTTWNIDPVHTTAEFKVRHMMITNVKGHFTGVTGVLTLDEQDITKSHVEASIDAASINTREAQRDAHLKSADFFDVQKFPTITFKSKKAEAAGAGKFKLTGDLTMRGVTKEVTLDVEGPSQQLVAQGRARVGATATTKINRQDYGVSWSRALDGGGVVVSDDVTITIELELVKPVAAAATGQ